MDSDVKTKAYCIEAYFKHLQELVEFLPKLHAEGRKCEALLLCCCYIEALGSRKLNDLDAKAKNYCTILSEEGDNEIWPLIHPKQLKDVLLTNGLFNEQFSTLERHIDGFDSELIDPKKLLTNLDSSLTGEQRSWFQDNIFKCSMAMISYERIRCQLVHDIEAETSISFSATKYNGEPVPKLNFKMHYSSLKKIAAASKRKAESTNKLWYENEDGR